jgi:hypothetical protein
VDDGFSVPKVADAGFKVVCPLDKYVLLVWVSTGKAKGKAEGNAKSKCVTVRGGVRVRVKRGG